MALQQKLLHHALLANRRAVSQPILAALYHEKVSFWFLDQ
jgi:hypothetical protein